MADTDDDGFIGLPPGIFESGTFKLPPKTERPRVEREEIVFVQAAPGVTPVIPDAAPATEEEPVSYETQREPFESASVESASVPVDAPQEPAPVTAPAPVISWRILLPEGRDAVVQTVLLVGRNPAPFDAYPGAELLPVEDSTQSVSKTHAAFEVDEQG